MPEDNTAPLRQFFDRGKRVGCALGVGAGNVPAYVEKTANSQQAAHDIVMSKAFDNGMICASEQAVIADKEIYKELVEEFKSYGVYFANKKEKAMLEDFIFGVTANCANCGGAKLGGEAARGEIRRVRTGTG